MFCPKCGSEYVDGYYHCKDCDVDLVDYQPIIKNPFAGFSKRSMAFLIDLILYFIFMIPITLMYINIPVSSSPYMNLILWFVSLIIEVIPFWLYNALMESSRFQGSLGKIALKIRVVDYEGKKITFSKATARHFSKIFISTIALCIGFLMAALTERKQCLHDLIAKTLVINVGSEGDLNSTMIVRDQ